MKTNLPSFLIIGAHKAGTSWTSNFLGQHPEIWMPPVKELHYFDYLFTSDSRQWARKYLTTIIDRQLAKVDPHKNASYRQYLLRIKSDEAFSDTWYDSIFSREAAWGKITGEATPEYCLIGENGIKFLKSKLPSVQLFMIVRNPVSRSLSHLNMKLDKTGVNTENLTKDDFFSLAKSQNIFEKAPYSKIIPQWKKHFGEKVHFLAYGGISSAPQKFLAEICKKMGCADHEFQGVEERVHARKKHQIPNFIKEFYQSSLKDECQFIIDEFGVEFMENT